jgi:hypothetical protein
VSDSLERFRYRFVRILVPLELGRWHAPLEAKALTDDTPLDPFVSANYLLTATSFTS